MFALMRVRSPWGVGVLESSVVVRIARGLRWVVDEGAVPLISLIGTGYTSFAHKESTI